MHRLIWQMWGATQYVWCEPCCSVPTWARTSRFHNKLQSITQTMMKIRGIDSVAEAVNFLIERIGHPCIRLYVNHPISHLNAQKAPHTIVPDTHTFNYPTECQQVNDTGTTSALPLMHSLISNLSLHTKANTTTTKMLIFGLWIGVRMKMKLFCLMTGG